MITLTGDLTALSAVQNKGQTDMDKQKEKVEEVALISWIMDGVDIVDSYMAELDAAAEADRIAAGMQGAK